MAVGSEQVKLMRWVLFWVFLAMFIVVVIGTLAALFFGFGELTETERDALFYGFIVEIGAAIVALFYSIFRLKGKGESSGARVRLRLGKYADVRKLVGKMATLAPASVDGADIEQQQCRVLDDNGPYLPLNLPASAYSVYVTIETEQELYSGSFVVGNYLVDLSEGDE